MLVFRLRERLANRVRYYSGASIDDAEEAVADVIASLYGKLMGGVRIKKNRKMGWIKWLYWQVRTKLGTNRDKAILRTPLVGGQGDPDATLEAKADKRPSPIELAQLAERWAILNANVLRLLTPMRRRIFFARFAKIPYDTIGEILEVSPGVARVVFIKTLRKLREACGEIA